MKQQLKKLIPPDWREWALFPIFLVLAFWPLFAASAMRNPSAMLEWYVSSFIRDFYKFVLVVSFVVTLSAQAINKEAQRIEKNTEDMMNDESGKYSKTLISIFNLLPSYTIWCSWLFLGEAILQFTRNLDS